MNSDKFDYIADALGIAYGDRCPTKDVDENPSILEDPQGRCPCCAAWEQYDELIRLRTHSEAGRVRVRPLVWETASKDRYKAYDGFGGDYTVIERNWWHSWEEVARECSSDDAAKAAAQADYEARILAALTLERVEQKPVAWKYDLLLARDWEGNEAWDTGRFTNGPIGWPEDRIRNLTPLYATPPAAQPEESGRLSDMIERLRAEIARMPLKRITEIKRRHSDSSGCATVKGAVTVEDCIAAVEAITAPKHSGEATTLFLQGRYWMKQEALNALRALAGGRDDG